MYQSSYIPNINKTIVDSKRFVSFRVRTTPATPSAVSPIHRHAEISARPPLARKTRPVGSRGAFFQPPQRPSQPFCMIVNHTKYRTRAYTYTHAYAHANILTAQTQTSTKRKNRECGGNIIRSTANTPGRHAANPSRNIAVLPRRHVNPITANLI